MRFVSLLAWVDGIVDELLVWLPVYFTNVASAARTSSDNPSRIVLFFLPNMYETDLPSFQVSLPQANLYAIRLQVVVLDFIVLRVGCGEW